MTCSGVEPGGSIGVTKESTRRSVTMHGTMERPTLIEKGAKSGSSPLTVTRTVVGMPAGTVDGRQLLTMCWFVGLLVCEPRWRSCCTTRSMRDSSRTSASSSRMRSIGEPSSSNSTRGGADADVVCDCVSSSAAPRSARAPLGGSDAAVGTVGSRKADPGRTSTPAGCGEPRPERLPRKAAVPGRELETLGGPALLAAVLALVWALSPPGYGAVARRTKTGASSSSASPLRSPAAPAVEGLCVSTGDVDPRDQPPPSSDGGTISSPSPRARLFATRFVDPAHTSSMRVTSRGCSSIVQPPGYLSALP
mmetsp:Transcript_39783/g.122970  ORF Transcript_39783/g.122970 Transcript_39783/m.122970 type:complete len:307 (+) Transcript_39783:295-1215(+)